MSPRSQSQCDVLYKNSVPFLCEFGITALLHLHTHLRSSQALLVTPYQMNFDVADMRHNCESLGNGCAE